MCVICEAPPEQEIEVPNPGNLVNGMAMENETIQGISISSSRPTGVDSPKGWSVPVEMSRFGTVEVEYVWQQANGPYSDIQFMTEQANGFGTSMCLDATNVSETELYVKTKRMIRMEQLRMF